MTLVRWNPWNDVYSLHNRINRIFGDNWLPADCDAANPACGGWNPVVDVFESDEAVVIQAELPGMDKKDISIDLKDRVLTISGERKSDDETKRDSYYRRERVYGKFVRSLVLPSDVQADKVKANYQDGVLELTLPKAEAAKVNEIEIK